MLCENCGNEGAYPGIDPFSEEIYNEIVEVVWCDDCYEESAREI